MNKEKFKVVMVTPELAKEYIEKNTHNRPLSKARVEQYANQMLKGQWRLTHEGIAFDEYGRLQDGQHRLHAIVKSGVAIEMLVGTDMDKENITKINRPKVRSLVDDFYLNNVKHHSVVGPGVQTFMDMKNNSGSYIDSRTVKGNRYFSSDEVKSEYDSDHVFYDETVVFINRLYQNPHKMKLFTKNELFSWMTYLVKVKKHPVEKVVDFFEDLYDLKPTKTTFSCIVNLRYTITRDNSSIKKLTRRAKQNYFISTWNYFVLNKDVKHLPNKGEEKLELK